MIGHRGASALAPENTMAAFRRAVEDGSDGVEFDVRLSGDGVPIVIHDRTLRRTGLCDGAVVEMTARELGNISVGNWFNRLHPKLADEEYPFQCVPLLDEVWQLFKADRSNDDAFARAKLYVEIKTNRVRASTDELVSKVVESVLAHRLEHRTTLLSFDVAALGKVRQLNSAISTGILFKPKVGPVALIKSQKMISLAISTGASEIGLHKLLATERTVRMATERNLRIVVWTVKHPKWITRAGVWGIHALITNNPATMIKSRSSQ